MQAAVNRKYFLEKGQISLIQRFIKDFRLARKSAF